MGDCHDHRTPAPSPLATTLNTRHRSIPCIYESHRFAWYSGISGIYAADTRNTKQSLNTMRILLAIERIFLSGYGPGTDLVAGLLHFANSKELFRARLCNLYHRPARSCWRGARAPFAADALGSRVAAKFLDHPAVVRELVHGVVKLGDRFKAQVDKEDILPRLAGHRT